MDTQTSGFARSDSLAVLIGVGKVQDLTPLAGVEHDLDSFQTWAMTQGFQIERFDDCAGEAVRMEDIRRFIAGRLDTGLVRLFVYFAGHGMVLGDEYWLLSNSPEEASINVARSVRDASHSGIAHVAIFSDACRSLPLTKFAGIDGLSLFPAREHSSIVEIDQFFATQRHGRALEVTLDAHGIFTRCLIEGLSGEYFEARRKIAGGLRPEAVLAAPLRLPLRMKVSLAASEVGHVQMPDCRAGSYEPNVLAWVPSLFPAPA